MFSWLLSKKRHYKIIIFCFLLLLILPSFNIIFSGISYLKENSFFSPIFFEYFKQTVLLGLGVCFLSLFFSLTSAIFVTFFDFPFRKTLEWALIFPFVLPSYLLAYIYTDFFEYAGFFQTFLRQLFSWESKADYWFPEIRSLTGAIFVLSLSLYPYLYLVVRKAFQNQSQTILQSGRLLGYGFWKNIFSLLLPLSKKSIFLGIVIVFTHTINDFGVVEYFSVYTFSLGIYDLWFQRGDFLAASYLATMMIGLLFFLVLLDSHLHLSVKKISEYVYYHKRIKPKKKYAILFFLFCFSLVFLGTLFPAATLIYNSFLNYSALFNAYFWKIVGNSIFLATITALIILLCSFFIVYLYQRLKENNFSFFMATTILGYALPGTVLSIGIVLFASYFNNTINEIWFFFFSERLGLVLGGGISILIFAYSIKFFAVAQSILGESFLLITPSLDSSGRTLGYYNIRILKNIYLPIAKKGFWTAFIILFVDIIRELPLTLILRPPAFDTLASYLYQYASDEAFEKASLGALFILLISSLPIILISSSFREKK